MQSSERFRVLCFLFFCIFVCNVLIIEGFVWPQWKFASKQTWMRISSDIDVKNKFQLRNAYLSDFSSPVVNKAFKSSLQNVETDIFGQLNFCLRQSDTVLSGPSRSKVLNEITNEVFKAIMIGFPLLVDDTLQKFPYYRNLTSNTPCVLDPEERNRAKVSNSLSSADVNAIDNCESDLSIALTYINWLEDLLKRGHTKNTMLLGGIYDQGYKRLLTILKDAHCRFPNDEIVEFRPIPKDHNICLSLLDLQFANSKLSSPPSNDDNTLLNLYNQIPTSKTQDLNQISNIVVRCILYGGRKERDLIGEYIDQVYCKNFAHRWTNDNLRSQEILYLQALALLLKEDLAIAEAAINFTNDGTSSMQSSDLDRKEYPSSILNKEWENISEEEFLRYFQDSVMTSSDYNGENKVQMRRKVKEGEVEEADNGNTVKNLRLFDTYQNAFLRVVEVCLTEIGSQSSSTIPQTDEFVQSFLLWEQSLRRNLTDELWNKNPEELAGTWELVNVGGRGSLNSIMVGSSEAVFETVDGVKVEFFKDGHLEVKHPSNRGENWFFKPGPAHLDTCEFYISSKGAQDVTLKYLGFIDRGQRIESRFSKTPIKMTGRVMAIVKGEPRGSSRFLMVLKRK